MVEPAREIVKLIGDLERSCAQAERELVALRWADLEATLAEQRRLIAALTNAVYATAGARGERFDAELRRRVARIHGVRDHQLKRIVAFRDRCRTRLTVVARAKEARRSVFGARDGQTKPKASFEALT